MTNKVREWRAGEQFVMGSAFLGLVDYLSRQPDAVEAFKRDTGIAVSAETPLDQMIDQATGRDRDIAVSFINWVQENHWGEDIPPDLALDLGITD